MPCRSYEDEPSYRYDMTRKEIDRQKAKAKNLKKEADLVTRLLCGVLREYDIEMSPELAEWHTKHEAADNKRIVREAKATAARELKKRQDKAVRAARASGRAKLTKAERKALGI